MRSLWSVMGVCVLAGACGRPNPGFKLNDSSDPVDSDGQSASGGLTETGSVSSAPTSTGSSTGASGVTGSESAASSSSTTVSDPTGDTGATTMVAGHWEFPPDCANELESEFTAAAADTFFLNEAPAGGSCSFMMGDPECQDMQFSLSSVFQLFLQEDLNDPHSDYVSIYAARFATPTPLHAGNIPIPETAFLAVEARIHLFRPFPANSWEPIKFAIRRFTEGDSWTANEGYDFTPCYAPATSYRCRICTAAEQVDQPCMAEWGKVKEHFGVPYDPAEKPIHELIVQDEPDTDNGLSLLLPFTKDDLPWLTADGLMLMPASNLKYESIEVKTLEAGNPEWHPGLRVRYCEPYFVAD